MSLFTRSTRNSRRHKFRKSSEEKWFNEPPTSLPLEKTRKQKRSDKNPAERVHVLNAQIGVIEQFLATRNEANAKLERMRREGFLVLPNTSARKVRNSSGPRHSHISRRRRIEERNRSGLRFFTLFCIACAIAWWLILSDI